MAVQSFVVALCVAAVLVDSMSMYTNDGSPITADAEQPISDGALADSALTETKRRMIARRFEGFSLNAYDDYDAAMSAWAEGLSDDGGEEDYYDFEMGSRRSSNGYEDVDYAALSAWFDGLSDEEVEYYYDLEMDAPELINVGMEPIAQANDGQITADAEQTIVSDGALADSALTEKKRRLIARRFEGFSLNAYDDDDAAMSAWADGLRDDDEDYYYDFEMGSRRSSNGYEDIDYAALSAWVDGLSDEEVEYYYDLDMGSYRSKKGYKDADYAAVRAWADDLHDDELDYYYENEMVPERIIVGQEQYSPFTKYTCDVSMDAKCTVDCNGGCGTTYIKVAEGTQEVEVVCTESGACTPKSIFMMNGGKRGIKGWHQHPRATRFEAFTGSVNCKVKDSCNGATFAIHNFAKGIIKRSQNALNCDFIFTRIDEVKIGEGENEGFNGNRLRTGEVDKLIITAEIDSFKGATIDTRGAKTVEIHCKGEHSCEEMVIIYMVYATNIEVRCGPGACRGLTFFMKDKITDDTEKTMWVKAMEKKKKLLQLNKPITLANGKLTTSNARKFRENPEQLAATDKRRTQRAEIAEGISLDTGWPKITVTFVDDGNNHILCTPDNPLHSAADLHRPRAEFSLMNTVLSKRMYMPEQMINNGRPDKTDTAIKIFVVDVDMKDSNRGTNINRVLADQREVSFFFQNNLEENGVMNSITTEGETINANRISGQAKGLLAFELISEASSRYYASAAAILKLTAVIGTGVAASVASAGVALIPVGLAVIGFGIKYTLKVSDMMRDKRYEALFSTGFEPKSTLSAAQRERFKLGSKTEARFAEYADALGEEAGQGYRSSRKDRRGRGRRAASARRNAKRLIRLSDLYRTD